MRLQGCSLGSLTATPLRWVVLMRAPTSACQGWGRLYLTQTSMLGRVRFPASVSRAKERKGKGKKLVLPAAQKEPG